MGATNIYNIGQGTDPRDVFNIMSNDAEHEYGYDPYNGTISTMRYAGVVHKVAENYTEKSLDKAMKYVERDGWGKKWLARCIDLGIVGWSTVTYEKTPRTSTAASTRFETVYVAYAERDWDDPEMTSLNRLTEVCVCKTAAEAKQKLKKFMDTYAADGRYARFYVNKEVRKVDPKASTVTFEMTRKERITKSKPKNAKNAKAIHKWLYYGWASI